MIRTANVLTSLLLAIVAAGVAGVAVYSVGGRYAVEKTLTALAVPCGLIWLGLAVALVIAVKAKHVSLSLMLAAIFLAFTLAGNYFSSDWLVSTLEGQYYLENPLEGEPLDLLIALGGGVHYLQTGEAQIGSAGDRVLLAARMYRRRKAKHLVATGFGMTPAGLDPMGGAKAAARVWQDLGVPKEAITLLPAANTSEEVAAIKILIEQMGVERVGLLTSAWHLPRAVRLAKNQGLDVVPVPADFRSNSPTPGISWRGLLTNFVPNPTSLWETSLVVKEYLAGVVGR